MQRYILSLAIAVAVLQHTVYSQSRPNILWITCEDMSANLPFYGDATIATPHLSRLAAEGVRYTRMFSVAGVCAPSRSAIISGMYPAGIGTQHMRTGTASLKRPDIPNYEAVPPDDVKCFSEYLRAGGYYCTNNRKTDYQFGEPFTAWDENSNKAHWRNRPAGSPFFAVFNITRTHESQVWAQKDKPLRVDPRKVPLPPYYPDDPAIRRDIARYYDNIMVMDSIAGTLLQQLEEDGLMDGTIIFFFSDHGAGLPWFKRELYDRGLHVPLVIRFPGKKNAGTTDTALHSFVDLAPTVLSLAGVAIPAHLQGQAFLGPATSATPRTYIYAGRDRMDEHYDMVRAVRSRRVKYIRNYQPWKPNYQDIAYRRQMELMQTILRYRDAGKLNAVQQRWFAAKPVEELYDLEKDPWELHNLADDPQYKTVLEDMRHAENDQAIRIGDKGLMPETVMLESMWPGGKQPVTATPAITATGALLKISCATPGASIAYKPAGEQVWKLYTVPISLSGHRSITAKAIRYGYKESEVAHSTANE